jgi:hypothetical protein
MGAGADLTGGDGSLPHIAEISKAQAMPPAVDSREMDDPEDPVLQAQSSPLNFDSPSEAG